MKSRLPVPSFALLDTNAQILAFSNLGSLTALSNAHFDGVRPSMRACYLGWTQRSVR